MSSNQKIDYLFRFNLVKIQDSLNDILVYKYLIAKKGQNYYKKKFSCLIPLHPFKSPGSM
jgi:hypothetical protein